MRRHKQAVRCLGLFLLLAGLAACGTPESIKLLSGEQLKAQATVRAAIDESFKRMEQVVELQLKSVENKINDSKRLDLVSGAKAVMVQQSTLTPEKFADITLSQFAAREKILAQARAKGAALKEAHANVLRAYDQTVEAQRTLDNYLRLEQFDEKVANELLLTVGLTREELENWTNTGLAAFEKASEVLAAIK